MTGQPILHDSFTLTRRTTAPADSVFAAFADLSVRQRWFRIPGKPGSDHHELDFHVGGAEVLSGRFASAGVTEHIEFRSRFLDIIENERIVYSYEFLLGGRRRSVSLVTIELVPDANGTLITLTEQFAFLIYTGDGHDDVAERKGGTQFQLNGLVAAVESSMAV